MELSYERWFFYGKHRNFPAQYFWFGTTRPNIRPLVLALNITNDLLFEQHISMSDIKATKHIYPDVARLLHKKPETVYKSVIRLAHRCWDALWNKIWFFLIWDAL